ncbi:RDD family protein [Dyella flava]|uniref:RDD family protein n=1 Tax=Dyella flava TaxID=1920170 RepID=A0ABS2K805_9GAMM|nr:RDD family protein [Dyella flava]MBM7127353.1 RDD family protein [Dyella flava]GLQ50950.1 hypothetical protein GCM10010872_23990 [Dyella flava]
MDTSVGEGRQDLVIAGFWRRLGAFFIDSIIVGLVGALIGIVLFDSLARMGAPARLIGFVIALAYFGVLNSRIGDGQTLANRWLGIRVVDGQGQTLSLPRALLRYTVLGIPLFFNGLPLPGAALLSPVVGALVSLLVFGGCFAIVYLYVFNRRTRQSLHDLAVGSYVVRVQPEAGEAHFATVWQGHLAVVMVIALLSLGAPLIAKRLAQTDTFAGILPLYQTLEAQPHVMSAQVTRGSTSVWSSKSGSSTTRYLSALLRVDAPMINDADYARSIAQTMIKGDPHQAQEDVVTVVLAYGYDMGIASWWTKRTYIYKPWELQADSLGG